MPPLLPAALGVLSAAGPALIWGDIRSKVKGKGRTVGSLVSHYLALKVVCWLGRRQRDRLEADTRDVTRAQRETLLTRMRKNADTLYGKRYDFSSVEGEEVLNSTPWHKLCRLFHYLPASRDNNL